jgi:hypothetical protein
VCSHRAGVSLLVRKRTTFVNDSRLEIITAVLMTGIIIVMLTGVLLLCCRICRDCCTCRLL